MPLAKANRPVNRFVNMLMLLLLLLLMSVIACTSRSSSSNSSDGITNNGPNGAYRDITIDRVCLSSKAHTETTEMLDIAPKMVEITSNDVWKGLSLRMPKNVKK